MASSEDPNSDHIPDHLLQPLLRYMEDRHTPRLDLSITALDSAPEKEQAPVSSIAVLEIDRNCIEDNESPDSPGLTAVFILLETEN